MRIILMVLWMKWSNNYKLAMIVCKPMQKEKTEKEIRQKYGRPLSCSVLSNAS